MTITKGEAPWKKKKLNCSQIQIKNLESPGTAPTIGDETEGTLCHTCIVSHSILVLRLIANVISSNIRASVSFFFSNAGALALSNGGGRRRRDEAGPAQWLYLHCCYKSVHIMGQWPRKTYAEWVQQELLQRDQLDPSCDLLQNMIHCNHRLAIHFVFAWVLCRQNCSQILGVASFALQQM
jgi:hypothetical protein